MQDESIEQADSSAELEPLLLYHESESRCATWRIADNDAEALVLFHGESAVEPYREMAEIDDAWRVLRPDRRQLALILQAALESGIQYAVLDPDSNSARRIFQLQPMWEQIQSALEGD